MARRPVIKKRPGPGIMSMLPERKPRPPRQLISPLGPSDRRDPVGTPPYPMGQNPYESPIVPGAQGTPVGLNPDGTPYVSSLPSAAPGVPVGPDGTPGPANIPEVVEKVKKILPSLAPEQIKQVVPKIPPETIKEVIPSLPPQTIKEVLPFCGTGTIKEVMPTLPPEVVKEVVPSLPPETIKQVLPTLPPEVAQEVIPPRRPMDADRPIGPRPPGRIPGGQPIRIPEPVGPPPFDPNLGQPSPDVQTAVDNMGWDIPVTPPQEDWVEDFMPPIPSEVEHDIPFGPSDLFLPEVQPPTTPTPEPFIPPEVLNPDGTPPWVDPIETAPDGGPPGGPPIGPTTTPGGPTMQVIVWGPDGTQYSTPAAAEAAGVTDWSMTPPGTPTTPGTPTPPGPVTPETTPVQGMTMEEMQKMIADMQAQQQEQAAARAAQEAEMSKQYMVYGDRTGYNPYQSGQYQSDPYGPSGVPDMGGITTIPVPGGYGIHNPVYERLRRKI